MRTPDSQHFFLADDALPQDEIDDLFEQLETVKPPPSLIQRILTSVAHLPHLPQLLPSTEPRGEGGENYILDSLVVRNEKLPPS